MPVRFENRFVSVGNVPLLKEFIRDILCVRMRRLRWAFLGILALGIAGFALLRVPKGLWWPLYALAGGLLVMFALPCVMKHAFLVADRRMFHDKTPESVVRFTDECITILEGERLQVVPYERLTGKVCGSENLIALPTKDLGFVLMKRGAFTVGKEEDLMPYAQKMRGGADQK